MTVRSVALVVLVVALAGCSGAGPLADDGSTTAPTEETATVETATTVERTDDGGNLWADETIVVAVDGSVNESRDWTPIVRNATAFWTSNDDEFLGYDVAFEVRPNAADPDVRVRFVTSVTDCEETDDPVGCAPYYTDPDQIDRPTSVSVESGLSDASTERVLTHELGHVLGFDHGEGPGDVMNHTTSITTLPQPDATERDLPWNDSTLSVYVDNEGLDDPQAVREQVEAALAYYERGANGTVPENVSFELVDTRSDADVVISFPDELPCREGDGSCGERQGVDVDGDGALEEYDRLEIALSGVSTETTGWHVAYWIGYGFGFTESEDWPAPLADADNTDDRSGEWWTD
jgi:predicted small lipoprotein YifL